MINAYQAGHLNGRQLVLLGTVGLHVLAFELLSMSVDMKPSVEMPTRMQGFVLEDPRPAAQSDPIARQRDLQPQFDRPQIVADEPKFDFDPPEGPTPDGADLAPSPAGGSGTTQTLNVAPTELSYAAQRAPDDFYPTASIRLGEEGVTLLRVCVGPAGQMAGAPVVTRGSGHARLDAAAAEWAAQALTFRPATRDGVPVAACKGFKVTFHLRN